MPARIPWILVWTLNLVLVACTSDSLPDPTMFGADAADASMDVPGIDTAARDSLSLDSVSLDSDGADAAAEDAIPADTPAGDTPADTAPDGIDAPADRIVVDGIVNMAEWADAASYENALEPAGDFEGNQLSRLRTFRDDSSLYLAIEGTITAGNAIVVYLDKDLTGPSGLSSPTVLDDFTGALDTALSNTFFTPAEFRTDHAFGVLEMNRAASAGDDRMGWRDVGTNSSLFSPLMSSTVCSREACETEISVATIGLRPEDSVGVFVRLVSATGTAISNQTLPEDADPSLVSEYATVP